MALFSPRMSLHVTDTSIFSLRLIVSWHELVQKMAISKEELSADIPISLLKQGQTSVYVIP